VIHIASSGNKPQTFLNLQYMLGCPFFASKQKMRNEAKRSEKDAKTNSKLARGSETKQNKVSLL
jgi:hypothetical protein